MDARQLLLFAGGDGGGGGHTGESGRLYIDGIAIRREVDWSVFPFRGADSYSLYHRFLVGEDIRPVLIELVALGFNVLRVFAMYNEFGIGNVNGLGRLHPGLPGYWGEWAWFAIACGHVGMRLEIVLLADAQDIIPDRTHQQAHVDRLYDLLERHWNVSFVETCNEPAKNGVDLSRVEPRQGRILRASGNYDVHNGRIDYVLDYVTTHTERKFEWPRTCRALSEIRDGAENLEAVRVPVVSDEPTGFAEQARPESRSGPGYHPPEQDTWTHLDDARVYAAGCQMHGAGSTFHSDDGVSSRLLGPEQKKAAVAWLQGAMWMPVEAQFAEYQRGAAEVDGGGTGPGVGDMPIAHFDLDEGTEPRALRTYAKRAEGVENCVAIRRSAGWFVQERRGCTLVNEWFPGLAKVREP